MRPSSYEAIHRRWASILDVEPHDVLTPELTVTQWDKESVELLLTEDSATIGAPQKLTKPLREVIDSMPFDLTREEIRKLVSTITTVEELLGPQFVGYADDTTFDPVDRGVTEIEPGNVAALRETCPEDEWERSGVRVESESPTFGATVDGKLVAVAQYDVVGSVAGIGVISRPTFRGEGRAKAVVSAATADAIDRGHLAEYRTLERWQSSVGLACDLGFKKMARSFLVRTD